MRLIFVLVFALHLGACGDDAPPAAPEAPPESPEADEDEREPEAVAPAPLTRPAPPPRPSAEDRAAAREAVRAGRVALRSGDRTAARGHFDRALELTPLAARVHCEAGFVAIDDDPDYAFHHLRDGLALFGDGGNLPEPVRVPYAMCLYNRGLLAERAEDWERALGYYERSLELRDSAVVREHLAAVEGRQDAEGDEDEAPDLSTLDGLVASLSAELVCTDEDDDYCVGGGADIIQTRPASDGAPEMAWIHTEFEADLCADHNYYVAIQSDEGYRHFLAWSAGESTSDHGVDDGGSARPGDIRVISPTLVRFEFGREHSGGHWGSISPAEGAPEDAADEDYYASESSRGTGAVLCDLEAMRCATTLLSHEQTSGIDIVTEEGEETPAWVLRYEDEHPPTGWEVSLEVDPERGVRAQRVSGEVPDDGEVLPVGRWLTLDEVFERLPEVRPY